MSFDGKFFKSCHDVLPVGPREMARLLLLEATRLVAPAERRRCLDFGHGLQADEVLRSLAVEGTLEGSRGKWSGRNRGKL